MRVVLDGVFNHCGRGFWPFHHVVENGAASPYRHWFHLDAEVIEGRRSLRPYPSEAEIDAIEAMRVTLGPGVLLSYVLQGLFHPARKVREVYWRIYNALYLGAADALHVPRLGVDGEGAEGLAVDAGPLDDGVHLERGDVGDHHLDARVGHGGQISSTSTWWRALTRS